MYEIADLYSFHTDYNDLIEQIMFYYDIGDLDKTYYIFIFLHNEELSKLTTKMLDSDDSKNLIELIRFVDYLKNKDVNTFITFNYNTKVFEFIFSKHYGKEDDESDSKILNDINIDHLCLTDIFSNCYSKDKIIIKNIEKITEESFNHKRDKNYIPLYYKDCILNIK